MTDDEIKALIDKKIREAFERDDAFRESSHNAIMNPVNALVGRVNAISEFIARVSGRVPEESPPPARTN